jgi:tRNA/rRNA methyltransferase
VSSPKKNADPGPGARVLSRRHIDIVLNCPQKPENIGGSARAVHNMGLGSLILVRPRTINEELTAATATVHALPVLESMKTFSSLREALLPYELVVGTTARGGSRRGDLYSPRQLAPELLFAGNPRPVALVFGPERMGLSTEDLRLCQKTVRIPTDSPEASSLNLAQAVLILGYELLLAAGGESPPPPSVRAAAQETVLNMYDDLESTLLKIGFLPQDNPGHWLMNIKKIFNRSRLTAGECDLLRGICRQIRWAVNNMDRLD